MYNCGVSGDNAGNAMHHITERVMFYEPTDVVIAFGMNDFGYETYDGREVTDEVIAERRKKSDDYITNIRRLADYFTDKGIRVSFCTPTAIDEFTDSDVIINHGASSALRELGERLKVFAKEYGSDVVDFHPHYHEMLKASFLVGEVINKPDRIHPDDIGAVLLAEMFLNAQGFDVPISRNYEELKKASQKTFSPEEDMRYEMEQKKQSVEYVLWGELGYLHDKKDIEEEIKQRIETQTNEFSLNCYKAYLNDPDSLPDKQAELKRYTKQTFNL